MEKDIIPKAEEFFEQSGTYPELAIEFAKIHVEAALKAAMEVTSIYDFRDEIKNSYPLTNIK
jgi:hypothetical protein